MLLRSVLDPVAKAVIIYFFLMSHATKIPTPKIEALMRFILLISYILSTIAIVACAPITKVSGYVPLQEEIEELRVGSSTKADIITILGEPLSYSNDASDFMIYVQQEVETVAFLRPKITDRVIVKLTFDESNILSKIERSSGVSGKPLVIEKSIVASEGRKLTFWQQMFGNIGNFSSDQFLD
ncbi:MAG: outer membrane protein assembly factor BamE [Paracoccaceae bacterium]|nr:outer membrane protein assembly factor BamE [Paracoccaceae bacterium]